MDWIDSTGRTWTTATSPLASGGQGEVFRTTDGRHAVKAARPGHQELLHREATALLELVAEHNGLESSLVVPRAWGESPRAFLVMDWYSWDAVRWLSARPRSLIERIGLAEACCRAVVALHWADGERARNMTWRFEGGGEQAGRVVHRDIKPGNFLLHEVDGRVVARLIDFGAVRTAQARTVTMATQIYTEGFAPMEQTLPRRVVPEVSWDVYALGATVFWILTGSLPLGCLGAVASLTPQGHQLQTLHRQALARPGASSLQVKRDELAVLPLSTLVDFSELRPFLAEDEQELRGLLHRQAAGLVRDLRRALAARPEERMTDARDLLQRLVAIRGELEGEERSDPGVRVGMPLTVTPVRAASPVVAPREVPPVTPVRAAQRERPAPVAVAPPLPAPRVEVPPRPAVPQRTVEHPAATSSLIPMVRIPSGSFTMGCTPGQRRWDMFFEASVAVQITREFWLGATAVTQAQWEAVMGSNPSYFKGADRPVEQVSWLDAVRFANALSEREGLEGCYVISGERVTWPKVLSCTGYRLPTEAEWEYVARAGRDTRYAGGDDLGAVGWYDKNSGNETKPVKGRAANPWGLYDMSGNVWEWVWDLYGRTYTGGVDPVGPMAMDGLSRVYRGGGWSSPARSARLADRDRSGPGGRFNALGFRLARSVP